MKAVPFPSESELNPTTSPAALMARGVVLSPPRVPSSREPPAAYQIIPRLQLGAEPQETCTDPTRSPAGLDPYTLPGRLSSCSICHTAFDSVQRTGTEMPDPMLAVPPTIDALPLMAFALEVPPVTRSGRSSRHPVGRHSAAVREPMAPTPPASV